MSAFAAWLALGLVLILWAALLIAWILALRLWRQVGPTVAPMLAMFAPAPAPVPTPAEIVSERCDYRGAEGDRCELRFGHPGPHEWPALSAALKAAAAPVVYCASCGHRDIDHGTSGLCLLRERDERCPCRGFTQAPTIEADL